MSVSVSTTVENADPAVQVETIYATAARAGLPLEFVSATVLMEKIPGIGKARVLEIREKVRASGLQGTPPPSVVTPAADPTEERVARALEGIDSGLRVLSTEAKRRNDMLVPSAAEEPDPSANPLTRALSPHRHQS